MTQLTLTQRAATAQRLDMRAFTPERLAALAPAEIPRLPVAVGNRREQLGELFEISGTPGERLHIVPAGDNLDYVGAGMTTGELTIDGDLGDGTGQAMTGGILNVSGSTGDDAGTGMRGGRLVIDGNAGERLGAPVTGAVHGMDRGLILVRGDAGERAGERMRRGLILIQGDAGGWCCADMIAGTVAVAGSIGPMAGSGIRRGTLLLAREPQGLPVTFNDNGAHRLSFLGLMLRELAGLSGAGQWDTLVGKPVQRLLGDVGAGGIGEILWPTGSP